MPCLSAMAAAVAGVASGAKADPAIMDAAGKDTLATLERVMSTQCGALRCEETVRTRSVNVLSSGGWARVAYPCAPGKVTRRSAVALVDEVWHVCGQEGVREKEGRIQFLTDGEEELEHVHQMLFEGWPNVTRALDAMHACEYGDTLCEQPAADEHAAAKASRHLRRTLVDKGWTGFEKAFRRRVPRNPPKSLSGDPAKAWTYLTKRSHQMAYPACRRQGLPIGSGMVESGCKNIFGARLESPGMRRRFANGLGPASIRVQIKSGLAISP